MVLLDIGVGLTVTTDLQMGSLVAARGLDEVLDSLIKLKVFLSFKP